MSKTYKQLINEIDELNELKLNDWIRIAGHGLAGGVVGGGLAGLSGSKTMMGLGALAGGFYAGRDEYRRLNAYNNFKNAERAYVDALKTHDRFSMSSHEKMNKLWAEYKNAHEIYSSHPVWSSLSRESPDRKHFWPQHQTIPLKP